MISNNLRALNESKGLEIFDITPIVLGGNPNDAKNKVLLSRKEHIEAVRYWNRIIKELRQGRE